jgi:hypothetical protein
MGDETKWPIAIDRVSFLGNFGVSKRESQNVGRGTTASDGPCAFVNDF